MGALLHFTVTDQELTRADGVAGATGTKNYLGIKVDFKSEPWVPELTTVIFTNPYGFSSEAKLDENGECQVPEEVTSGSGLVQISLCYEGTIKKYHRDYAAGEDSLTDFPERVTTNAVELYIYDSMVSADN